MRISKGKHDLSGQSKTAPTRLPLLHFKFFNDLNKKIEDAIESKAYWRESRHYYKYQEKLKNIDNFMDAKSQKLEEFSQLIKLGFVFDKDGILD